jgi:hypothetical protein
MTAGMLYMLQSCKTPALNFINLFPSPQCRRSLGPRFSKPMGNQLFRIAGGPPGMLRTILQLLHGVPIQIAQMRPLMIKPRINF